MIIKSEICEQVIQLAEKIQQIPAPTFAERQRAQFIHQKFIDLGLQDVLMDDTGNVYAQIKGKGEKRPVVVSAHLDTVFPASTDLSSSRTADKVTGAGIGDNSLGLAGLFGLYWILSDVDSGKNPTACHTGDIWLAANVGEEGLGNLCGMKAVVNRFEDEARAYIILEGMSLGQIYHQGLGVKRYRITVNTKGGHSWVDYGRKSAIHELAELVVKIKNLDFPAEPRTSFNVGTISGGTSVNTIAAEANLQLDLRSVNPKGLCEIANQVEALVNNAKHEGEDGIQVVAEVIGERPPGEIPADHSLITFARECHMANGISVKLNIGSTDANEPLSRGYPAICMGLTTGGGAHTTSEYIDIKPLAHGLGVLADLVLGL